MPSSNRPSEALVDFVVDLVVDPEFRRRYHEADAATRDQIMVDRGLDDEERQAIRDSDAAHLERLINTQVVSPGQS